MLIHFRQRQGQSVMGQYAIVFFVVIATISVMTVYVRRGLQGRIYDAKKYMIDNISAGAKVTVAQEYEPYYTNRVSDRLSKQGETVGFQGGQYSHTSRQKSVVNSVSGQ